MTNRLTWCCSIVLATAVVAFSQIDVGEELIDDSGPQIVEQPAPQPLVSAGPDAFHVAGTTRDLSGQLEQYHQHVKGGRWEKAFRVIEELNAIKPEPMVRLHDGFVVPLPVQTRRMLLALPPEGRKAFDLFYGPKVEALLRLPPDATPQDEIARLREAVEHYPVAAPVPAAMDRLGDACFEAGDFRAAADCWNTLIVEHPDPSISIARLLVKRGIAQARGGDGEGLRQTVDEVRRRFPEEKVRIGDAEVSALDTLTPLLERFDQTVTPVVAASTPPLRGEGTLAWSAKILDENMYQSAITGLARYGIQTPVQQAPPATATDGRRVFVSAWGVNAAIDGQTGKELWRTTTINNNFRNNPVMMIASLAQPRSVTINGDSLLLTAMDPNSQVSDFVCVAAASGATRWSGNAQSQNKYVFIGAPLLLNGEVVIGALGGEKGDLQLLALDPANGAVRWSVTLGSPTTGFNGYGPVGVSVELAHENGQVYVSTNDGAVVVVDTARHRVAWAFTYPVKRPPMNDPRFGVPTPPAPPGGAVVWSGLFIFKDSRCDELVALRVTDHQVAWKIPVGADDVIVGADDHSICLLGTELTTYRPEDGSRVWWSNLFGTGGAGLLAEPTRWTICGSAGVFQIDRSNGKVVGMLRGIEAGPHGAGVLNVGGRVMLVTPTSVDAYDVSSVSQP